MTGSSCRLVVAFFAGLVATNASDGDAPRSDSLDLRATQVTLAIDREGRHHPFRATVLAISGTDLTVLTAARFASDTDKGHPVRLVVGEGALGAFKGTVQSVVRNPAYRPPGLARRRPDPPSPPGSEAFQLRDPPAE